MSTISKLPISRSISEIKSKNLLLSAKTHTNIGTVSNQNFNQFKLGECFWLASIDVLSRTQRGVHSLSTIIKEQNGNKYILKFPFSGQKISVKTSEIDKSRQAKGNEFLNILEVGWSKLKAVDSYKLYNDRFHNLDIGGQPKNVLRDFIYGKKIDFEISHKNNNAYKQSIAQITTVFEKSIKEPDKLLLAASKRVVKRDKKTGKVIGAGKHAYAIRSVKENVVTLANPWNNSKSFKLSFKQFFKSFDLVQGLEIYDVPKLTKNGYQNKVFQMPDAVLCKETRQDLINYFLTEPSKDKQKQYILNIYNNTADKKKIAIWKNLYLYANPINIESGKFDDDLFDLQKVLLKNSNEKIKNNSFLFDMPVQNQIFLIKKRLEEKPDIETVKAILSKMDYFVDDYITIISNEILKTKDKSAIIELVNKLNSEPCGFGFNPLVKTKIKIIDTILENCTDDSLSSYINKIKSNRTSNIYKFEFMD